MFDFPYMKVPSQGRPGTVLRPVVMFVFEGPGGKRRSIDLLVDTGADGIVLPTDVATSLDITLPDEPEGSTRSLSGDETPYFGGRVVIEIRRSPRIVRWSAKVAFVVTPARCLFGQAWGLQFFHAHFLGPECRLLMEPQPNLPDVP